MPTKPEAKWAFLRVDRTLLRKLKIRAAREGTSMVAINRKLLLAYLAGPVEPAK